MYRLFFTIILFTQMLIHYNEKFIVINYYTDYKFYSYPLYSNVDLKLEKFKMIRLVFCFFTLT